MILPSWWGGFLQRIDRLRELIPQAIEDGERDTPISPSSLRNCETFASRLIDVARPGLFIHHDGCARLVWQCGDLPGVRPFTEQVAIKFRDDDRVDFVLFRSESVGTGSSTIMGTAHVDAVLGIVAALGLDRVMTAAR